MDLRAFAMLIRRRWSIIAGLVAVGIVAAVAFSALQTPVYTSTAKLLVSTPAASNASDLQSGSVFTQQVVTTYAEVATTPYVLQAVIQKLGLDLDAGDLADDVKASAPASTSVIDLAVTSSSAGRAADVANAVAAELAARAPEVTPSSVAGTSAITISVIQPAVAARTATSPNWLINVPLGFLVGLFLGVGVVVIRDTIDTRLRTAGEAARLTELPVLGDIVFDADERRSPLITGAGVARSRVETYRLLRTTLEFLNPSGSPRAYVVASASQGEGAAATTANAAIAFAAGGKRVVLVDADVNGVEPSVTHLFALADKAGLTDVLGDTVSLDKVFQTVPLTDVVVLPAGRPSPVLTDSLRPEAIAHLLDELRQRFDVMLIAVPPVLDSTDGALFAQHADGVILIAAQGRVRRDELRAAAKTLRQVGAPMLGVVVRLMRGAERGAALQADPADGTKPSFPLAHADE